MVLRFAFRRPSGPMMKPGFFSERRCGFARVFLFEMTFNDAFDIGELGQCKKDLPKMILMG